MEDALAVRCLFPSKLPAKSCIPSKVFRLLHQLAIDAGMCPEPASLRYAIASTATLPTCRRDFRSGPWFWIYGRRDMMVDVHRFPAAATASTVGSKP